MRIKGACLAVLLTVLFTRAALAEDMHLHAYGGSGKDTLMDVIALRNGGFLMVGSTLSNDGDLATRRWNTSREHCDAWAVFLDSIHNIRYQIIIGQSDTANEQFTKAMLLPDGSVALVYEYIDEDSFRYELQQYSDAGLYIGTIPVPPGTVAVYGLDDSFLFVGGFNEFFEQEAADGPWLARYTFDGLPVWMRTYGNLAPWTSLLDAAQDDRRLLCAGIWRESFADYSGNIVCLDMETGETLWNYRTDPKGFARLSRLTALSDGSVIAVGWKSGMAERDGGLVVRVDKNGRRLWKKTIYQPEPDSAWFTDVMETSEGVMLCGDHMFGDEPLYTAGWILSLDDRGASAPVDYVKDSLLNLKKGRLIRGMDGPLYYFGTGGKEPGDEDFFIMRLDRSPDGSNPLAEFDGMGEYE